MFLQTLLASATDFLGVRPTQCVISAPSWFTATQQNALRKTAEDAGMKVLQVLDEAAAVLVGYRVGLSEARKERGLLGQPEEGDAGEVEKRDKKVVVLDMGETSLGVSVIQVADGEYTVLASGRDDKLGGREFDDLVSDLHIIVCSKHQLTVAFSCLNISPKSSRKRPRLHSTCRVTRALRRWTSGQKPSFSWL